MVEQIISWIRRLNDITAIIVGIALLATVIFILIEITYRQLGGTLGGTDEISGYVMAGATSWGIAYALTTLTHVRIDLVRLRFMAPGRAMLDILATTALTAVAVIIAVQCWPVLSKTLMSGALANTPLETPLWIPQVIWWSGWVWFAVSASALLICAVLMLMRREFDKIESVIGVNHSGEQEL